MKRVIILLAIFALLSVPLTVFAHEKSSTEAMRTKGERVYCCWGKGKCDKQHTKDECNKEGGKIVSNCRECK
jgi:hypothetical protein